MQADANRPEKRRSKRLRIDERERLVRFAIERLPMAADWYKLATDIKRESRKYGADCSEISRSVAQTIIKTARERLRREIAQLEPDQGDHTLFKLRRLYERAWNEGDKRTCCWLLELEHKITQDRKSAAPADTAPSRIEFFVVDSPGNPEPAADGEDGGPAPGSDQPAAE